ncbi:MAG: hypothetical protein QXW01_01720 [Candidatus Aenigmatarchaeota archaeon]
MKAYIVTTIIGVFGVSEDKKILIYVPFKRDAQEVARKLKEAEVKIIEEEKEVEDKLRKKGYRDFVYSTNKQGVKNFEENNSVENFIKDNLIHIAIDKKFVRDEQEFYEFFNQVNIEMTKVKIKLGIKKEAIIIQAVRAMEELDKIINVFSERLREWYGLHFPELNRVITSHEKFAKLVEKYGKRENFEEYEALAKESIGIEISEKDERILKEYASFLSKLFTLRENLEKYVKDSMEEIAPNFSYLAGPLLAAKILSRAGSLEKLAKAPASLIQLIGAEKALFRYLHGKGKSPKHGLIYLHPYIQNAKEEDRGKVARVLANKLSLAIRVDYYTKENRKEQLKKDLDEKIKEVLGKK